MADGSAHRIQYHGVNGGVQSGCAARRMHGNKTGLTSPRQGSVDFNCPPTVSLAPPVQRYPAAPSGTRARFHGPASRIAGDLPPTSPYSLPGGRPVSRATPARTRWTAAECCLAARRCFSRHPDRLEEEFTMATGKAILAELRPQLESGRLSQETLGRHVRRIPRYRRRDPGGDSHRLSAAVRHDSVARHRRGVREQGEGHALSSFSPTSQPATEMRSSGWIGRSMQLVNTFKSAAKGYGTERRVLLLHGPVGSSKSTIARLLKKGLEEYSQHRCRACCFRYCLEDAGRQLGPKCPMHEDPLHLVPHELRPVASDPAQRRTARPTGSTKSSFAATCARSAGRCSTSACRSSTAIGTDARRGQGLSPDPVASRTASASAPSSPRTKRTRTRPS